MIYFNLDKKEFYGVWTSPDSPQSFTGILRIEGRGIFAADVNGFFKKLDIFDRMDENILFFKSFEGYEFTCLDCMSLGHEWSDDKKGRTKFQIAYIFYGGFYREDDLYIKKLSLFDSGYTAFNGVGNFSGLTESTENDVLYSLGKILEILTVSSNLGNVSFRKGLDYSGAENRIEINVEFILELQFNSPVGMRQALDAFYKIKLILEYIGCQSFAPKKMHINEQDHGIIRFTKRDRLDTGFTIRRFLPNLDQALLKIVIQNLCDKIDVLANPLQLLWTARKSLKSDPEKALLLSVQSFEIVERESFGNKIIERKIFRELKIKYQEFIDGLNLEGPMKEKMSGLIDHANEPNLKIRYQIVCEISGLKPIFNFEEAPERFIKIIVDNRNYLTHFSRVPEEMVTYRTIEKNITIIDAMILRFCGPVDDTFYAERYGYRWKK